MLSAPDGYVIRPGDVSQESVLDVLHEHTKRVWGLSNTPDNFARDSDKIFASFIEKIESPAAFIAYREDVAVGSSLCYIKPHDLPPMLSSEQRKEGFIGNLWTNVDHRRKGLGTALMLSAIAHLKDSGCTRIHLTTSPENAIFYQKLGFDYRNVEMVKDMS